MKNLKLFEEYHNMDTMSDIELSSQKDHSKNLTNLICKHLIPIDRIRHRSMINDIIEKYFKKYDLFENFEFDHEETEYDSLLKSENFNKLSYKDKIKFLEDTFALSKREVYEICDEDTNVCDLPDEIKYEFD